MSENTIKLAVYGNPPVELELINGSAISVRPGMLLWRASDGLVYPHWTLGGVAKPSLVAVENPHSGGGIYDNYAQGDKMYVILARPGDKMWMWLATGEISLIGSPLGAAGGGADSGYLASTGGAVDGSYVGIALEVVDATLGPKRIKIEIM